MKLINHNLYLFLQKRLLDFADDENYVKQGEGKVRIAYTRIPKKLVPALLKEMEELELIKRIDKFKFKVINTEQCKEVETILEK